MLSVLIAMLMLGTTSLFAQSYNVTFPTVSGTSGSTTTKAIVMNSNLTGQNVLSFGFKMKYDPNVVEVSGIDLNETILQGKDVLSNIDNVGGVLTVGWLSSNPLAGTGDFLKVTFLFKNAGVSTLALKVGTTFDINTSTATVVQGSATTASKVLTVGSSSNKKVNEFIDIPITVTTGLVSADNVVAYDFTASYDATALEYVGVIKAGTLSASAQEPIVNALPLGSLNVAVISSTAITGSGDLLYIRMKALKKGAATFTINTFQYNSGTPSSTIINGTFSVANTAPVLTAPVLADQSVSEGSAITIPVTATDADGASDITYNAPTLPAGIPLSAWNSTTNTLTWTPDYNQSSATPYQVIFSVTDGSSATASFTVNITVNNTNRAPSLTLAPTTLAYTKNEGETLAIQLTGTDSDVGVDGDELIYSMVSTPLTVAGATLNPTTGAFSWPISFTQSGSYTFAFTVTDSRGITDTKTVTVTVDNVNTAPRFDVTGAAQMNDVTIAEGETLTFTYKAIDAENDVVTYKKLDPTPASAALDANSGVFSWKTNAGDAGTYTLSIQASDGILSTASRNTTVTVTSSAKPTLAISPAGPYSYPELTNIALTLIATDVTRPTATFTYEIVGTKPTGSFLNTSTGAFAWTPAVGSANTYNITFKVTDSFGFSATQTIALTVTAAPKPTLTLSPAGPYTVAELSTLSIVATGADTNPGATFTLSAANLPTGAIFTASNGTFTWTPTVGQAASSPYNVTFTVTDNYGLLTSQTVAVAVTSTNVAPTLTVTPALVPPATSYSVNEGQLLTLTLVGADANAGDVLAYSVTAPATLPEGSKLTDNSFTWTPTYDQGVTAAYSFTFKVADAAGLFATVTVSVKVNNVNRAPVFTETLPANVIVDVHKAPNPVYFRFTYKGNDPDGGPVAFSLLGGPANSSLTVDGEFSWSPTLDQAGKSFVFTVEISDGLLRTTKSERITASSVITAVEEFRGVPTEFNLMQNYPNPFNPTTTIRFALPTESYVKLSVFNILGQEVAELVSERMTAGFHKVDFDASKLNSGMYIYRIQADKFVSVKKMLLVK